MKTIDATGKPCPIPVIEAKKILTAKENNAVTIKVDNIVAVENLKKMADGYGYEFSYNENKEDSYDVSISKKNSKQPVQKEENSGQIQSSESPGGMAVLIGSDRMGQGAEELGKILIKGFIYSLSELPTPPKYVIFLNSGAYLTAEGANTLDDLKRLEEKGTEILTCGTCINYYELQDRLAVGKIVNMYEITERLASANSILNI